MMPAQIVARGVAMRADALAQPPGFRDQLFPRQGFEIVIELIAHNSLRTFDRPETSSGSRSHCGRDVAAEADARRRERAVGLLRCEQQHRYAGLELGALAGD